MEQEPKQIPENQGEASPAGGLETGIPRLDWGLRIRERIVRTTDPKRRQKLEDLEERYWAETRLIGLYE